uniref:Uncharacterized protein n=1 Tax=Daucus carota subsp. sativus TaxID=79200 RepID=A0A161ZZW9_DAUCS
MVSFFSAAPYYTCSIATFMSLPAVVFFPAQPPRGPPPPAVASPPSAASPPPVTEQPGSDAKCGI